MMWLQSPWHDIQSHLQSLVTDPEFISLEINPLYLHIHTIRVCLLIYLSY